MEARRVAILGFHKIGAPPPPPAGWESWFYVSVPAFDRFLGALADAGFEAIALDRFLAGLDDPASLPERSALITFDDGYRSMVGEALPVLRKHGAPGVLFVPTGHVGGINGFDHGVEPEEPICTWDELRTLRDGGVSIQSHAHTHRAFTSIGRAERADELARSKAMLEKELGGTVDTIAFPYGDAGPDSDRAQAAEAGYRAAFTYRGAPVRVPVADRYRIERIAMGPDTDLQAELEKPA